MNTGSERSEPADAGFTLIEVVVAMFVLAIFALALIPAFITGFRATATNTTLATANQVVATQIDAAQTLSKPTCDALQGYQVQTVLPVVDQRGVSLQAVRLPITCPATYPGIAKVTVQVHVTGNATVISSATTYVLLTSLSST